MSLDWLRRARRRRLVFVVLALVFGLLCLWPRSYVARADLLPQDSGGLNSLLGEGGGGGLLSLGALLGSHQSIESDLTIARSAAVERQVLERLATPGSGRPLDALALRRKIDIAAIRGSILQISARDRDPGFARTVAGAYVGAIRSAIAELSLREVGERRAVAENRLRDAAERLALAQAALSHFRSVNKLAAPEVQLGAAVSELATLQGRLQAKQVELQTLSQFATGANVRVQAVEAEIAGLQTQIAVAQTASRGSAGLNLAAMALQSSEYLNLYRDEKFAESLYGVYTRYLEQVTVDEMSANASMEVIEPPYVDPARQYNAWAVGLLVLIILAAVTAEFYLIAPPVGART